jgi:hypothetical protein
MHCATIWLSAGLVKQSNLNRKDMRTIKEIDAYLDAHVSIHQLSLLEAAHWRYMRLCGVVGSIAPADRLDADRAAYPQYIKHTPEGDPILNSNDCIAFMACVSGVSLECCQAWMEKNFLASMLECATPSVLH